MQHLWAFLLFALSVWSGLLQEMKVNAGSSSIMEGLCADVLLRLLCGFGFVMRR